MTAFTKILPMLAALASAQADPHAGHHPPEVAAPAAPPAATPTTPQAQGTGCQMMSAGMMGGQKPADGAASAPGTGDKGAMGAAPGQMMAANGQMMNMQGMQCSPGAMTSMQGAKPGATPSMPDKHQ